MNHYLVESSTVRDIIAAYPNQIDIGAYHYWQGYSDIPIEEGDEYLDPNVMTVTSLSKWITIQRGHWGHKSFHFSTNVLFRRRKGLRNAFDCKNFRYQTA